MNRQYQDRHFTLDDIAGRKLLRLCAAVDPDAPDTDLLIVYARIDSRESGIDVLHYRQHGTAARR